MTDCKHTIIKPGDTFVWTGESKSPPYACRLCEMERLRSTLELARVALWFAFDDVRQVAAADAEVERLRGVLDLIERETLEVRIQEVARIALDARKREAEK